MSILQKLTEGVQSRDMQAEGAALLNKWEATGLLEGLNDGQHKQGMAVLLENQAKELLREASSMAAGDVEGFAAVAFPIVRRVFGGLIANDLVSVQPMSLPSGLIFFLDFTHSDYRGSQGQNASVYGGGKVGRGIIDGLTDEGILEEGHYGLGGGYAHATGSVTLTTPATAARVANPEKSKDLDFDADLKGKEIILVQPTNAEVGDMALADPAGNRALQFKETQALPADGLFTNVANGSRLIVNPANGNLILVGSGDDSAGTGLTIFGVTVAAGKIGAAELRLVRRLTDFSTSTSAEGIKVPSHVSKLALEVVKVTVDLSPAGVDADVDNDTKMKASFDKPTAAQIITAMASSAASTLSSTITDAVATDVKLATIEFELPLRDDINASSNALGAVVAGAMPLEEPDVATGNTAASRAGKQSIAEIDIKVDSVAVTAQTKKLKAKWSPELGQDLTAYHNLDAEVELTGILSEQIALEIDRELLGELVDGATAGTRYWSRAPGLFVDSAGTEIGASSAAPDFTGTVSEWYETLIETINDVSAQIHRKTLRGGANFVVCSPEVANILEFTSGFRASVTADQDRGTIGAVKAGSLSKKFDVYVDPYFLRNVLLVGRKGSSFLESGFVYAPYVPLQVTPTIFGTEDFVPRKGVMTRYAKKMVRPDMYGLVIVRGLLGEAGATS